MELRNDRLLRALRREPVDRLPVWLMRQAGRYLPEYNATRRQAGDFLTLCKTPELACEVTLQPLDRYPLDAAILFSDILTVPDALGLGLHFVQGEGPRFHHQIASEADLAALRQIEVEEALGYVGDAVETIRKALNGRVPLIGFSGSPWTLACYMIAGGSSSDNFFQVRRWVTGRPDLVLGLIDRLTQIIIDYCSMQIRRGAQTMMLFDSWGGLLTEGAFPAFSRDPLQRIVAELKQRHPEIPVIVFVKGGGVWLEQIQETGCDAMGLDWTVNLASARQRTGDKVAFQGNLDPAVLLGTPEGIRREARRVVESFGDRTGGGHVFNLGHGISQFTPPEYVEVLLETVAEASAVKL